MSFFRKAAALLVSAGVAGCSSAGETPDRISQAAQEAAGYDIVVSPELAPGLKKASKPFPDSLACALAMEALVKRLDRERDVRVLCIAPGGTRFTIVVKAPGLGV